MSDKPKDECLFIGLESIPVDGTTTIAWPGMPGYRVELVAVTHGTDDDGRLGYWIDLKLHRE